MFKISINKNKFYSILWLLSWLLFIFIFFFKIILENVDYSISEDYLFVASAVILITNLFLYSKIIKNNWNIKRIMIVLIILSTYLLFFLPITSTDVYAYIYEGRVWSIHEANPYTQAYRELKNDDFYNILGKHQWSSETSLYGPLFAFFSFIITLLGKSSFILSVYLFKIFTTFAHIFNSFLIYKITRSKQILLLFAFNPLLLFEFIVNGHNDVFMISFMLLAFYFLLAKKFSLKNSLLSIFLLTLSGLIKYFSLLLLPVFFLLILKKINTRKESYIFAFSSIIISIATIFLLYSPFIDSLPMIIGRLLSKNSVVAISMSSIFMDVGLTTARFLNLQKYNEFIIYTMRTIFLFSYFGVLINIIISKNKDFKKSLVHHSFIVLGLLYLLFFTWLAPWYYTLIITILILKYYYDRNNAYLYLNYVIIFYSSVIYLGLR